MGAVDLLSEVGRMPLPEAAARFAAAGVPVFPCVPGEKRPLVRRGFHEATANAAQVAAWWSRWPQANIGIPTGAASGVEVVDVDVHATGTGFPAFRAAHREGLAAGWAALVRTPSGGLHAYYPAGPDRSQSSWQAARAHVDFRGDGGYIIAPPSRVLRSDGVRAPYRLIVAGNNPMPVDAVRLRGFLDPRTPPPFLPSFSAWLVRLPPGSRGSRSRAVASTQASASSCTPPTRGVRSVPMGSMPSFTGSSLGSSSSLSVRRVGGCGARSGSTTGARRSTRIGSWG